MHVADQIAFRRLLENYSGMMLQQTVEVQLRHG
jgi:hypothetical protein